ANTDELLNQLPNKLISNLPYAVAATIVLDYFTRFPLLRSATIMVQKEVAQRMCAQPGTKAYGAYTVKLSLLARPVGMFSVAPSNFFPAPHVESTVIRLDRLSVHDAPYQPCELPAIQRAIEAAFANRRKTVFNSMRTFFAGCNNSASKTDARGVLANNLLDALHVANIAPDVRGETLSCEQFITLGKALLSCGVV
ncbi:dimethyladenosine transferase domain protein, partial [Umbribacter vaginalis]